MIRKSPTQSEMFEQSSEGGYPYNSGGNVIMRGGTGEQPSSANTIGLGGRGGGAGLSNLSKPTSMQPAQNGQVGPNPMKPTPAPVSNLAGLGGLPSFNPMPSLGGGPMPSPGVPGGAMADPISVGNPVLPRPAFPQASPPNGLQPTPPAQRSAGFGGLRPAMSY